jgi:hypothetical protein
MIKVDIHIFIINNKQTTSGAPGSRVVLENLIAAQLVKKSPAVYGNRRFVSMYTRDRY